MDEPTNHLDIQSVNILIQALQQYEGTFISVSHDRYFLDHVANKIWFIEEEQIKEYPGTYAEYEEWNSKRVIPTPKPIPVKPAVDERKKPVEVQNTNVKQQLKKLNDKLKRTEEEIAVFEASVKGVEADLAKEEIYANPIKLGRSK